MVWHLDWNTLWPLGSINKQAPCVRITGKPLVSIVSYIFPTGLRPGKLNHKSSPGDSFCADRFENHWATKALGGFHLALYLLCPAWFICLLYRVKIAFLMQWSKPSHRPPLHTCLAHPWCTRRTTTMSRESARLLGQKLAIFYKNSMSQSVV